MTSDLDAAARAAGLPSAEERQRSIWTSRVRREFEKCGLSGALPAGISLRRVHIDDQVGEAAAEFHCFVPFQDGSDALFLIPLTALVVSMPFSSACAAQGVTQFPFLAPHVEVTEGRLYLPSDMVEKQSSTAVDADGDVCMGEPRWTLKLPLLDRWSPSHTLAMVLEEFFAVVQQHDPRPAGARSTGDGAGNEGKSGNGKTLMRMRKRDVHGTIYPTEEVVSATSSLRPMPMLLQSGNVALLSPPARGQPTAGRRVEDDPYVYVVDLIPLRDVARITPQRGKSLTLFFKDHRLPCRTFLTAHTEEIIADIRRMVASKGGKRSRDDTSGNSSLSQLLPFLSPEHTEKAKEMSGKFMSRLNKYANSMSRFLRGDDDSPSSPRQSAVDPLARAFTDIDAQKAAFFRTPSKARMTEITRRYQHIAEHYAHADNHEGHVERAIEELQAFIEHPKAQRILLEDVAYEQMNKGIRVGPA